MTIAIIVFGTLILVALGALWFALRDGLASLVLLLEVAERIAASSEALREIEALESQQRAEIHERLKTLRTGEGRQLLRERLARHLAAK